MNALRSTATDSDRLDRFRTTVELIGTLAVAATQVATVVGTIASIVRRRSTGCR